MNILLYTDGSSQSKKATNKVASLVKDLKSAKVTIIHVWGFQYYTADPCFAYNESLLDKLQRERENVLDKASKVFHGMHNVQLTQMLKSGCPAEILIEVINNGKFDLVVIGNRRLNKLKRFFGGSVGNIVKQKINADLLMVE